MGKAPKQGIALPACLLPLYLQTHMRQREGRWSSQAKVIVLRRATAASLNRGKLKTKYIPQQGRTLSSKCPKLPSHMPSP